MISVLAILVAVLAVALVVLGLRLAGAKSEGDQAVAARHRAEVTASTIAKEFGLYRKRQTEQMSALRADIEELENDLENCDGPGDRRERLRRLLSKAETRATDPH